jgi:hypothetical protein
VSGSRAPPEDNFFVQPRAVKNHAKNHNEHFTYEPAPKQTPPLDRLVAGSKKLKEPIDFNKRDSKQSDLASIRIRDPVTSKVKTIYLNDDQIEELSKRHENDKTKVNNTFSNKIPEKSKVPFKYDNRLPKESHHDVNDLADHKESIIDIYNKQQNEDQHVNLISSSKKPISKTHDDDAKFEELVERHKNEKQKVNQFEITEITPYTVEQIEDEVNRSKNSENNQIKEK